MKKLTTAEKIRRAVAANPSASIAEIAKKLNVRYQAVWSIVNAAKPKKIVITKAEADLANKAGVSTKLLALQKLKTMKLTASRKAEIERQIKAELDIPTPAQAAPVVGEGDAYEHKDGQWQAVDIDVATPKADNVNHPPHYKQGGIETIDFIEAKQLNYHLGNVIKYVTRADHKGNKVEDLKKARWYLNREISKLDGAEV